VIWKSNIVVIKDPPNLSIHWTC